MNKKIIWGVVVVVILVVVGWIIFNPRYTKLDNETVEESSMQTQNDQVNASSDWKTYKNSQYGFEIKHPSDSTVQQIGTQNGYAFEISTSNNGKLVISTEDTIIDGTKRYGPGCGTASGLDPSVKIINGVTFNAIGVSREFSVNVNTSATEYCAAHNGFGYKIISKNAYGKGTPVNVDEDKTLNDMIASFKFTSSATVKADVDERQVIKELVENWRSVAPAIIPNYPNPKTAFYGYPESITFIGNQNILITYENNNNAYQAVLAYKGNKTFAYVTGAMIASNTPSPVTAWLNTYGSSSTTMNRYNFSSTREGDVVYPTDWVLEAKQNNSNPSITVISPNGGETLKTNSVQIVKAAFLGNSVATNQFVDLFLDTDNDPNNGNGYSLGSFSVDTTPGSKTFSITIPAGHTGNNKIYAILSSHSSAGTGQPIVQATDYSDNYFTITN